MDKDFTFFPVICAAAAGEVVDSARVIGENLYKMIWDLFQNEPAERRPHLVAITLMTIENCMRQQMVANAALYAGIDVDEAVALLHRQLEQKRAAGRPSFQRAEAEFARGVLADNQPPAGTTVQ